LLETNWGQRNEYTRFSPGNNRLGCWSTALAQIAYYHRLRPHGSVNYTSTYGYVTDEDFDSYQFDWDLFTNKITGSTPEDVINETVRYVYYTACAVQKDWGTGSYMLSHWGRSIAMENHYGVNAYFYYDYHPMETIRQVVQDQVRAGRPVMMHLRDLDHDSYHAVVVDAWRYEGDAFMVHIEYGSEGSYNGWYDFDAPIRHYNDNDYRRIMTITPGDFDGDYDVDADDVDILAANLGGDPFTYDMDGDVDEDDMTFHVTGYLEYDTDADGAADGIGTFVADFNTDGTVDLADLTILRTNSGQIGMGFADGDTNCDGAIDLADLTTLRGLSGSSVSGVPEPATLSLLMLGTLGLLQRRRARSTALPASPRQAGHAGPAGIGRLPAPGAQAHAGRAWRC